MKYLTKSNGIGKHPELACFDDWGLVVRELDSQWDDFISCIEFREADVAKGGVYFDVTDKVCEGWLRKYGGTAEMVDGELDCPRVVKDECPQWVAELEGEAMDFAAEERAMHRDYYNSLGVRFSR